MSVHHLLSIVVICCPLILVPEQETTDYTVNLEFDEEPIAFAQMEDVEVPEGDPGPPPKPMSKPKAETIRSFFPETWIWELVSLG